MLDVNKLKDQAVQVNGAKLSEFMSLMRRATNTMEPQTLPTWVLPLMDSLEGTPDVAFRLQFDFGGGHVA